jgi:hypothetical protein
MAGLPWNNGNDGGRTFTGTGTAADAERSVYDSFDPGGNRNGTAWTNSGTGAAGYTVGTDRSNIFGCHREDLL